MYGREFGRFDLQKRSGSAQDNTRPWPAMEPSAPYRIPRFLLLVAVLAVLGAQGEEPGLYADFDTSAGRFRCRLDPERAPKLTANFVGLATGQRAWFHASSAGARTNSLFEGVRLLAESGLLRADCAAGAPGYELPPDATASTVPDTPGLLGVARTNAAGFFVTFSSAPAADSAIFGKVTDGLDVISAIASAPVGTDGSKGALIRGVTIRRIGAAAEAFDIQSQGLPEVRRSTLGISADHTRVTFWLSNEPYVDSVLFGSTDLESWSARDLGLDLSAPPFSSWTQDALEWAEYFQLAQVTYPGATFAPRFLTNQVLDLTSGTNHALIRFDAHGRAETTVGGARAMIGGAWRQGAYRGWVALTNFAGTESATLLLEFANAARVSFSLHSARGGAAVMSGAFALADLPDGLEAWWPLNGDWHDATGRHDLLPKREAGFGEAPQLRPNTNGCYGPTHQQTTNGARCATFTGLPEDRGLTLEGWVWLPDDSSSGLLFGFGDYGWEQPKLNLAAAWGFIWAAAGRQADGTSVQYPRIGDRCWHHLALVLPAGFRSGAHFRFYLDGVLTPPLRVDTSATGDDSVNQGSSLFGAAFGVGDFNSGSMKLDEVRVWSRELSAAEIAAEAHATGVGSLCENAPPPNWAPGPRFLVPSQEPKPALTLGVHLLTDDTIAVITDPNAFLKERLVADCGLYLRAMETNRALLPPWLPAHEYELATREVILHYRPPILEALARTNHFTLSTPAQPPRGVEVISLWPQATREFRFPSLGPNGGAEHTPSSENVFYSYLRLPFHLSAGQTCQITDEWGNSAQFTYDENQTISWALKVNQIGYLPDAPEKFAYLGAWLGGAGGAMDLSRFEAGPFSLCREADAVPVFTGTITFRGDESTAKAGWVISGEKVYQLDFSKFNTPGRYFIRVPGAGRSWAFELGQNALGEPFYTYLRSFYHQRCGTNLTPEFTPWSRGDAHTNTWRALLPTESNPDVDHTSEGWGVMDASGKFPSFEHFQIVQATATTNLAPGVRGGWHDAGDFDRVGFSHLRAVEDLVESYLLFPDNFTDGQARIPESGNGVPDILDEAMWGVEVWRRAQEPDGRVALWIEATSHPKIADPCADTQPYYLGVASHNSSLEYAEHAARLARGLALAGAPNPASLYLESAKRAYAFGADGGERIIVTYDVPGGPYYWKEPPHIDAGQQAKALIQLWLASGDPAYFTALNTPEMTAAFTSEVGDLYWRTSGFDFMDVALAPERFPDGWGDIARKGVIDNASEWLGWQQAYAYRKLWYAPGQGYFSLMGWGNCGFLHIRELVAAWRLTGETRFRAAALNAVDWMHGANPQGRVNTTGLGYNYPVNPLHLPSDVDGIDDPVPGINLYGYTSGITYNARAEVYGLFSTPIPTDNFSGAALAQLPPPWNDPALTVEQIASILYSVTPLWRNICALEAANPPQMEFTVPETQGPAVAVTGCLLGAGWKPSEVLIHRPPRSEAQLQDCRWYHP